MVIYGHDARRGLVDRRPHTLGLDTGCVYGGCLTGFVIESGEILQVNAARSYYLFKKRLVVTFPSDHRDGRRSFAPTPAHVGTQMPVFWSPNVQATGLVQSVGAMHLLPARHHRSAPHEMRRVLKTTAVNRSMDYSKLAGGSTPTDGSLLE